MTDAEIEPVLFTSSVEALVMLPLPSVTMKPPAPITAELVEPINVKASVPVGNVVLDCAKASPERVPLESISMNLRCVASIATTSYVIAKFGFVPDGADEICVAGVEDGPRAKAPVSVSLG